jgi:hypothetical protein
MLYDPNDVHYQEAVHVTWMHSVRLVGYPESEPDFYPKPGCYPSIRSDSSWMSAHV